MSRTTGGRFGQELELQRSTKEPVFVWRREWVVPSGLHQSSVQVQNQGQGQAQQGHAQGQVQGVSLGLAERLGPDAEAMRSSTPVRILKWVRTSDQAHFDDNNHEQTRGSSAPAPSAEPSTAESPQM